MKVYLASVLASPALALLPDISYGPERPSLLGGLLLLGVWVGDRVAWGLTVALLSVSLLLGLFATAGGSMFVLLGILAVWIGLLVAAPTQRWVFRDRFRPGPGPGYTIGRGIGRFVRSEWRTRPLTLRIYVGVALIGMVASIAVDPSQLAFPSIILTILSLVLLLLLWNGSAGMWWLSVIASGAVAAASLAAFEEPSARLEFALSVTDLMLLVHPSTRAWFNRRIAERFP